VLLVGKDWDGLPFLVKFENDEKGPELDRALDLFVSVTGRLGVFSFALGDSESVLSPCELKALLLLPLNFRMCWTTSHLRLTRAKSIKHSCSSFPTSGVLLLLALYEDWSLKPCRR
jgi:hypothetical protein